MCALTPECKVLSTELVKTKLTGVERLDEICKRISLFIDKFDGVMKITREEFSFSSKGRSIFDLGALGGCVDLMLFRKAVESGRIASYHKIPPNTHKKFCIQNGAAVKGTKKAEKRLYLDLIKQHTGENFDDDNVGDSYMLARTLLGMLTIQTDSALFGSLSSTSKEALIPPKFMKDNGLTPGKIRQMTQSQFSETVRAATIKTYMVFECAIGNVSSTCSL
jgi:hypothetical protein